MSTNDLVHRIGQKTSRLQFIKKATVATAGLAGVMLGYAPTSTAGTVRVKCCDLCFSPSSCSTYTCVWCWYCCHTDHRQYKCCERFYPITSCSSTCTSAICSTIQDWGTCLSPLG